MTDDTFLPPARLPAPVYMLTVFPPGIEAIRAPGVLGGRDVDGVDADAESPGGRDDELGRQVREGPGHRNTRGGGGGGARGRGVA